MIKQLKTGIEKALASALACCCEGRCFPEPWTWQLPYLKVSRTCVKGGLARLDETESSEQAMAERQNKEIGITPVHGKLKRWLREKMVVWVWGRKRICGRDEWMEMRSFFSAGLEHTCADILKIRLGNYCDKTSISISYSKYPGSYKFRRVGI